MATGNFHTQIMGTTGSLTVEQFSSQFPPIPSTPGNVGICLSGGGSRALTAGMGQLQALRQIQVNGLSLLSQVKAISTVSGGSWLGVPYLHLANSSVSDSNYLGTYVDPSQLTVASIQNLPEGNIGSQVTHNFSVFDLLAQALIFKLLGVPANMLWQTAIALHILDPYNLFARTSASNYLPIDMFTYNQATRNAIVQSNLSLINETAYTIASGSGRDQRPFMICNFALQLKEPKGLLAPVQTTSFGTGVVGPQQSGAQDQNGLAPGGGFVTSFAFNSTFVSSSGANAVVSQQRQWSLTDAVGTSSAAFAAALMQLSQDLSAEWKKDPKKLEAFALRLSAMSERLKRRMPTLDTTKIDDLHRDIQTNPMAVSANINSILSGLIPQYGYFPAANPATVPLSDLFADGGNLENTGINGMLAYSDIDSIIAFVNSQSPLAMNGSNIVVDDAIPPLFGYQPSDSGNYVLYQGAPSPSHPEFSKSQVFDSTEFANLRQGLWAAYNSSSGSAPYNCAIYQQRLTVIDNPWFGIHGSPGTNRAVNVLWVYLNNNPTWIRKLNSDVTNQLPVSFPHYDTITMLELTNAQVNLMANLTAWGVLQNSGVFTKLFTG